MKEYPRYIKDQFYWVKLKPYEADGLNSANLNPKWEPMQCGGSDGWARAGVIYRFPDEEIAEVGRMILHDGESLLDLLVEKSIEAALARPRCVSNVDLELVRQTLRKFYVWQLPTEHRPDSDGLSFARMRRKARDLIEGKEQIDLGPAGVVSST